MTWAALLLAGSVLAQNPTPSPQHVSKVSKRDVSWSFATTQPPPYSEDVLNWSGWSFLPSSGRIAPGAFRSYHLPQDIEDRYSQVHSKVTDDTPAWRIKVFAFRESDILERDSTGVLRRRFSTLEPYQVDDLTQALARLGGLIEIATNGAVKPQIDLEVDTEPQQFEPDAKSPWNSPFAEDYLAPRINGPGFEPDDKVYRGPFGSVFYIHPGLGSDTPYDTWVNESPVTGVSAATGSMLPSAANLDATLLLAWERQAHLTAIQRGAPADFMPSSSDWKILAHSGELDSGDQVRLMTSRAQGANVLQKFGGMFTLGPNSENVTVSIAQDPDKGSVLNYTEAGLYRAGGAVVPRVAGVPLFNVGGTPLLSFSARSTAKDPVALALFTASTPPLEIVLGNNVPTEAGKEVQRRSVSVEFRNDGTWQTITLDLRKYLDTTKGAPVVTGMQICPPASTLRYSKATVGKIDYQFGSFAATPEGTGTLSREAEIPAPSLSSVTTEGRAYALAQLDQNSPKQDLASAEGLLNDPSSFVRLNAAAVFTRVKTPTATTALIQASHSIDPRVAQTTIAALAFQDNDEAWQAIRNALVNGPFDADREAAAKALGSRREPSSAGPLSTAIDTRNRAVKIAAIQAISRLPGDKAPLIALAFLNQDDPQVRLAATRFVAAQQPEVLRQLLYSAVNDTSDRVRTESYLKLLGASNEEFKSEAYKGVRDDGLLVRLALVRSFAAHPNEEQRQALRLAVTDSSAYVRAAAIAAFTSLPKGVEPEEIENTFSDNNPLVQLALLDAAAKGTVKLPAQTVTMMKVSPVPSIAARAKSLN